MEFLFLKELNQILEQGFDTTRFRVPEKTPDTYRPPTVHVGAIPPRRPGSDKEDFPFLVTRIVSGEDQDDGSTFQTDIICGVFTGDTVEAGENEILNMVFRARSLILENQIIAKKYRCVLPVKWHLGDVKDRHNQAYPFFGGVVSSTWAGPAFQYLLTTEEQRRIYGYFE